MNQVAIKTIPTEEVVMKQGNVEKYLKKFESLYPAFAERAAGYDESGSFVQENYNALKEAKLFSVGIPADLGGGELEYSYIASAIKEMAKSCGSTALSYAMHTHPVLLNVYKYLNKGDEKAKAALTKIAGNELVIAGTGANDWLQSNGTAAATDGGYIVNADKRFVSGAPGAQVFVTSAVESTESGDQVLHFSIPFSSEGVEIQSNWNTMGMRGTGSNDVLLRRVFVPEEAVVVKRPVGEWHPMWDMVIPIAMPLIVSCYTGLAEKAVEIAIKMSQGKHDKTNEVGEMLNHLRVAQSAMSSMVGMCEELRFEPSLEQTDAIFSYKTIATNAIHASVNRAANLTGGAGFFKGNEIERIMRDVRALHFHPLPEPTKLQMSGRIALNMSPV
jgi:acyl-CoA dehydrogenase